MKVIKKILISIICLLSLVSCGDGLSKYRRNGQLVDLDYEAFNEKMINNDSFVFFLTRNGCHGCKEFYPVVSEYLKDNKETTIYRLNESDMEEINKFTIASYYVKALGSSFYEDKGYSTTTLYTPSVCKIEEGEFVYVKIGNLDKEEIADFFQDNYLSLNTYYGYNRKVQNKETFNLFVSTKLDEDYENSLRKYFIDNPSLNGYYLDSSGFDESENERLLNRINYYLGEENEIENLPDYCLLQYQNGLLVNYMDVKYDIASLNNLYNKN